MGEVQGQIDRLRGQIKAARVVQRQSSGERAGLGSKVILSDLEFNEELDYTLVGPGEVDTRRRRISIQSPVGNALKDHGVGDVVEVEIPSGLARYRIERIEPDRA
jgi:transcription elongation factor GreA